MIQIADLFVARDTELVGMATRPVEVLLKGLKLCALLGPLWKMGRIRIEPLMSVPGV